MKFICQNFKLHIVMQLTILEFCNLPIISALFPSMFFDKIAVRSDSWIFHKTMPRNSIHMVNVKQITNYLIYISLANSILPLSKLMMLKLLAFIEIQFIEYDMCWFNQYFLTSNLFFTNLLPLSHSLKPLKPQ